MSAFHKAAAGPLIAFALCLPARAGLEIRPGDPPLRLAGEVTALAVADSGMVAAGSARGQIEIGGAVPRRTLRPAGEKKAIAALSIAPGGERVAAVTEDRRVLLLDRSGKAILSERLAAPGRAVAFSEDGRWLVAGTDKGTVAIWALRGDDGEGRASLFWEVDAGRRPVREVSLHDGLLGAVVGKGAGTTLKVWDVGLQKLVTPQAGLPLVEGADPARSKIVTARESIESAAFSGEGGLVAVGYHVAESSRDLRIRRGSVSWRNRILIYRGGRLLHKLGEDRLPYVRGLSFGADGRLLASSNQDPGKDLFHVTLWDAELERALRSWPRMRVAALSRDGGHGAVAGGAGGEVEWFSISYPAVAAVADRCEDAAPAPPASGDPAARPTVSVLPVSGYDAGAGRPLDPGELDSLTGHAAGAVSRSGLFQVVDARDRLSSIREQRFALSDLADADARVEMGKLLAGEYLLGADVLRSSRRLLVNARLVSTTSGEILHVGSYRTADPAPDSVPCALGNAVADLLDRYRGAAP